MTSFDVYAFMVVDIGVYYATLVGIVFSASLPDDVVKITTKRGFISFVFTF